jgi:hypothetical protein
VANQEQATALLSQIPFGAIIGGPLKAAVDAQAAAAVACYDFVSKIGFSEVMGKDTNNKDIVVGQKCKDVVFTFERTDPNDNTKKVQMAITVPVLTIMPIPFIRIESLTVNFKASISAVDTTSQETKESTDKEGKLDAAVGFPLWKVGVSGGISSKKDSTSTSSSKYSVEHTMDVSVHAVQDDMPAGMAKLLDFMTRSIVATVPPTAVEKGN